MQVSEDAGSAVDSGGAAAAHVLPQSGPAQGGERPVPLHMFPAKTGKISSQPPEDKRASLPERLPPWISELFQGQGRRLSSCR